MKIEEYESPPQDFAEEYAPDPRASQNLSARKRAAAPGRPSHDTEPIRPLRTIPYLPIGVGVILVVAAIVATSSQFGRAPATPLAITPGPSTAALLASQTEPTATPEIAPTTETTINAYDAPGGHIIGPIGIDRMMTPIAHAGGDWIQSDVAGSGLVWLRASDVPDLAIVGPDLAAPAPQTGRGLTVEQGGGAPAAPATPEPPAAPPEPTATVVWATSAPAKAPDFAQPSVSDRCKMIGCLGNQAVQSGHEQACHALAWQYGDSDSIPEPDLTIVRQCTWEGLYK